MDFATSLWLRGGGFALAKTEGLLRDHESILYLCLVLTLIRAIL